MKLLSRTGPLRRFPGELALAAGGSTHPPGADPGGQSDDPVAALHKTVTNKRAPVE